MNGLTLFENLLRKSPNNFVLSISVVEKYWRVVRYKFAFSEVIGGIQNLTIDLSLGDAGCSDEPAVKELFFDINF